MILSVTKTVENEKANEKLWSTLNAKNSVYNSIDFKRHFSEDDIIQSSLYTDVVLFFFS